jgi:hypothetical protein
MKRKKRVSGHSFGQIRLAPYLLGDLLRDTARSQLRQSSSFDLAMMNLMSIIYRGDIKTLIIVVGTLAFL